MSASRASRHVSRSPNGCSAKPIYVSLRPSEREEIEGIADLEQRSVSATARLLTLKGLEAYRKETAAAGG